MRVGLVPCFLAAGRSVVGRVAASRVRQAAQPQAGGYAAGSSRHARSGGVATLVVGPMTEAELREAIAAPARRAKIDIEDGLEIVRRLAASVRIDGDEHGRTIWALFPWQAKG